MEGQIHQAIRKRKAPTFRCGLKTQKHSQLTSKRQKKQKNTKKKENIVLKILRRDKKCFSKKACQMNTNI